MDNPDIDTTPKTENKPVSSNTNQENPTPPIIVIILNIIFPPIAWYIMYKEKRYHKWISYILWIQAGLSSILYTINAFYIYPQLKQIYFDRIETYYEKPDVIPYYPPYPYLNLTIPALLAIIALIISILLLKKIKEPAKSYKKLLYAALGILAVVSISNIPPLLSLLPFIIGPLLYKIINSIQ